MTLGLADLNSRHEARVQLKSKLKELNDEVNATKKAINDLDDEILLCIAEVDRITMGGITYFRQRDDVVNVVDWDAFYEYIKENDAVYLLQRRVLQKGALELLEDGEVPGLDKLTITKLGARASD